VPSYSVPGFPNPTIARIEVAVRTDLLAFGLFLVLVLGLPDQLRLGHRHSLLAHDRGHTSSARGATTVQTGTLGSLRIFTFSTRHVAHVDRVTDGEVGDVDIDAGGMSPGYTSTFSLPERVVQDAARVADAVRDAGQVDRDATVIFSSALTS
jgi:hypothetical protein